MKNMWKNPNTPRSGRGQPGDDPTLSDLKEFIAEFYDRRGEYPTVRDIQMRLGSEKSKLLDLLRKYSLPFTDSE
jgi:hypothetical protein